MLQTLSVQNFKSWRALPELRFGSLTGFFGANSSGKSGLLHLLLLLKQTAAHSDRSQPLHLGDDRSFVSLGTFPELLFGHDREQHFAFDVAWHLPQPLTIEDPEQRGQELFRDDQLRFQCEIKEGHSGRLVVESMDYRFAGRRFGMTPSAGSETQFKLVPNQQKGFRFKRTQGRAWALPAPVRFYGFPDQVRAYYQNAGFLSDLELALEEQFAGIHYLGPLRDYPRREYTWAGLNPADMGQRGENAVEAILASRERGEKISRGAGRKRFTVEEYVAWWLKKLGLIHEFGVEPIAPESTLYRVWVRKGPTSTRVLITDVGFGVSQILPVITLCYYAPPGSTIILEQPEIHLHPSVQAGLADVLLDAIAVRKVQVLIESHSEHLLRRLQRRISEEVVSAEYVKLYFCDIRGGASRLTPLDLDVFGSITNWPRDFFGDEMGEIAAMSRAIATRRGVDVKAGG